MSGFGLFGEAFVLGRFWVAGMIVMLGLLAVVVAVVWFGVPKRVVVPGVPQVAAEGVEREMVPIVVRSDYIGPPVGFHGRPRGVTWLLLDDGTKVTVWADSPGYGAMWVGDGVDVVAAREFLEGVGVPLVAEDEGLD